MWYEDQSPWGIIRYQMINDQVTEMFFVSESQNLPAHPLVHQALHDYLTAKIPLHIPYRFTRGTSFQKLVWSTLTTIPLGETWSYQQLAEAIGNPKAIRAVGQACKRNPIGLIIPCHRVIGKDGSMTGYSGPKYIGLKSEILAFEKE